MTDLTNQWSEQDLIDYLKSTTILPVAEQLSRQLLRTMQHEQEIVDAYELALKNRDEQEEEMEQFMNKREAKLRYALELIEGGLRLYQKMPNILEPRAKEWQEIAWEALACEYRETE